MKEPTLTGLVEAFIDRNSNDDGKSMRRLSKTLNAEEYLALYGTEIAAIENVLRDTSSIRMAMKS